VKLLVLHNSYQQPGGEDEAVRREIAMLRAAGHQVRVFSRHNGEIHSDSTLAKIALAPQAVWARDSCRELKQLLGREKPDLAHFHNTFPLISPGAYYACREAGVPVVQTLHNYRLCCPATNLFRDGSVCEECMEHSLWRSVAHGCYRGSHAGTAAVALMLATHRVWGTWTRAVDCYIALTEFARRKFIAAGIPAEKIVVKSNFVSPDPSQRSSIGEYALFAGRLSQEKGLLRLLAAWARLRNRIPLLVAGDGPMRARLETEVARRRLSSIAFRGYLPPEAAIAAMKQARFLVVPSECYEGFPLTIAEAFACGTPVVCSRLGGMQEIVADGITGLHFAPGDAQELCQKVEWAWSHPDRTDEMGRRARQEYESKYTAEKNYSRLMEIYDRTLSKRAQVARTVAQPCDSQRFRVLGIPVDAVQICDVIARMEQWIGERSGGHFIAVTGMHGITEAQRDPSFKQVLSSADMVVADGMPLVWLGRRQGYALEERVYGPELMEGFLIQTGAKYRHFFYGGGRGVAERLAEKLREKYKIQVAGFYSPVFQQSPVREDSDVLAAIETARTDVLWVGLGTPKQERWMHIHRELLSVPVLVGVGAAFDLLAGRVKQAPHWMRENGLEWFFRLTQEPRRLWRRYLVYGSEFAWKASLQMLGLRRFG
jgi:exopolysaccharide biosynthesis WecB/TagA/CpsF family protein